MSLLAYDGTLMAFRVQFDGLTRTFLQYSGFLMANNCGLISQNGITESLGQMCQSGYSGGASVTCDGNKKYVPASNRRGEIIRVLTLVTTSPTAAVDTKGNHWKCSPNLHDISCDEGGSMGRFNVKACCSRA